MASDIHIGEHYERFLDELVESGRYFTHGEAIRDGLRMLEEREKAEQAKLEALREEIRRGRESGPGIPADEFFDQLEQKYRLPKSA